MSGKSGVFITQYDAEGFCTNVAYSLVSFFPVSDAEAAHSQLKKKAQKTLFSPDIFGRIHIPAHPELRLYVKLHMAPNTEGTPPSKKKKKRTRVTDENRMPLPRFSIVSSAEQQCPRFYE